MANEAFQEIEAAIERLENLSDPVAREQARRLVASVLAFHRAGLERICQLVDQPDMLQKLGRDELVGSLLSLHDLHPEPLAARVERALLQARAQITGQVELLECAPQEILLSLRVDGCASSNAQARAVVEAALLECAPDAGAIRYQEPLVQIQMRLR